MYTKMIIGLFILLCAVSYAFTPVEAQKKSKTTIATHMWAQNYESVLFVRVRSLEECEMLTRQAAALNSTESNCYNGDRLLKKIRCTKSTKKDGEASCS